MQPRGPAESCGAPRTARLFALAVAILTMAVLTNPGWPVALAMTLALVMFIWGMYKYGMRNLPDPTLTLTLTLTLALALALTLTLTLTRYGMRIYRTQP